MVEEKERKMSDEEWLLHIRREVARIKEEFDIRTEKELEKYEKKFPEIVDKIRESMKCKKTSERLRISMEALIMSYKIGRSNHK